MTQFFLTCLLPKISFSAEDHTVTGKKLYKHYCAQCHGSKGKGDGENSDYLSPPPADLTDKKEVYLGKMSNQEIYNVIAKGGMGTDKSPRMPFYGNTISEYEMWTIVAYVRTLHPNQAEPVDFSGLSNKNPEPKEVSKVSIGEPSRKQAKKGKKLYKKFGCAGCHKAGKAKRGGESGPELNGIASEVDASEIFKTLKAPRLVRKRAKMPNFGLSDEEALSLTHYLLSL